MRFPLTVTHVAHLLETAGVQVGPGDIALAPQLTSSVPTPQLAMSAVDLADDAHLRIRVTCSVAGQCLPFFAVVDLHDSNHAASARNLLHSTVAPALPMSPGTAAVLRAGEHAVLLLEDPHMQVKIPVIIIDTGKLGAEIRVASLDRKQTYRAVVDESGVVRGALP